MLNDEAFRRVGRDGIEFVLSAPRHLQSNAPSNTLVNPVLGVAWQPNKDSQ